MRLLMISVTFPYPPTAGGTQVRTFNLLRHLQRHHEVTLVTQTHPNTPQHLIEELRQQVDTLKVFPRPDSSKSGAASKAGKWVNFALSGTPPSVRSLHSPAMQNWLDEQVTAGKFEAVTCEHCVNEQYLQPGWSPHLRKSIVNIHSSVYGTCRDQLQTQTSENVLRDKLSLPLLKRYEQQYCQKFTDLVVTTEEDYSQLLALSGHPQIHVIPNGVDLVSFPQRQSDPGGQILVFIGAMDNLPNIDAVTYLAETIFPKMQQRYPEAQLYLVGARPTAEVRALEAHPGVVVTGRVESMVDYLHKATVSVIPMRTGYGIKNKTLESMAAGIPVVASDRGLEGLAVDRPDGPLRALRANTPEDYVSAIGKLFEDATLRQRLSENARAMIEAEYTWEIAGQRYECILSSDA